MDTGSIEMPKSVSELPERQVTPAPSLEKRSRRQFSPEYKLRIIAEADACKHGELGALLTRKLEMANDCLDLQKKALSMIDRLRNGNDA
jgi:transposase